MKRIVQFDEGADPDQIEYAMRFDFLSTLVFNTIATPSQTPVVNAVVKYNTTNMPGLVTISGYAASGDTPSTEAIAGYFTKSTDGTVPEVPFRKDPTQVAGALGADGEGIDGANILYENWMLITLIIWHMIEMHKEHCSLFLVP